MSIAQPDPTTLPGDDFLDVENIVMTLVELRDADDAWRAYAASKSPRVVKPLGLGGRYKIAASVSDSGSDYFLAYFNITLTPNMTAWDVLRELAIRWSAYGVMDDFIFSHLSVKPDWLHAILWADVSELQDEQLNAMPFEQS